MWMGLDIGRCVGGEDSLEDVADIGRRYIEAEGRQLERGQAYVASRSALFLGASRSAAPVPAPRSMARLLCPSGKSA